MFKSIRLPLFDADDGSMGGGVSGDGSVSSNSEVFTPGWGLPGNQAAERPANPLLDQREAAQPQEPAGQVFDFAGRKIEVADPAMLSVLKDIHKDYSALNSTYTQTSQRVKELETANTTYLNLLQNMQQQPADSNDSPSQDQISEEDMEQMRSDFMESFYDDPRKAIEGMLENLFEKKVQPVIEPISKEREWNEQVQAMEGKFTDFRDMVGPMQQLLQDMPELAQHGLESVYHLAKRTAPASVPAPDQLLNDANFRQQLLQNQEVQKAVVSHYLQNRQDMNQQIPVVMGGQPGGQAPAVPELRPTDIRSASKAFLRQLGL